MATLNDLYDAFLALLETDEWETWESWEREEDWFQLYLAALPWFKFPRVDISVTTIRDSFGNTVSREFTNPSEITNNEIQILVLYMKVAWFGRVIDSWENLRPLYTEADFSPAKQLSEFSTRLKSQTTEAKQLEAIYYRSINGKPFDYGRLAGGGSNGKRRL